VWLVSVYTIWNCIFVCPVPDCRASCVNFYSVLISNLFINHCHWTWIPLDMGVTWQIIVVWLWGGWTKLTIGIRNLSLKSSQEVRRRLFCLIFFCLYSTQIIVLKIFLFNFYWPLFNLCMYDHTHCKQWCTREF